MLCAIYKSVKKDGMYLYIEKRDQFEPVPSALREMFGTPKFVMLFNLKGEKSLKRVTNQEVLQKIASQGYYLQMPDPKENLHSLFLEQQKKIQGAS